MRYKTVVAVALTAVAAGAVAAGADASSPPDHGNCLASFVNGGAQGSAVSSDPGGPQASRELGQFLRETRGRC